MLLRLQSGAHSWDGRVTAGGKQGSCALDRSPWLWVEAGLEVGHPEAVAGRGGGDEVKEDSGAVDGPSLEEFLGLLRRRHQRG